MHRDGTTLGTFWLFEKGAPLLQNCLRAFLSLYGAENGGNLPDYQTSAVVARIGIEVLCSGLFFTL
jgi:hypothetical protein